MRVSLLAYIFEKRCGYDDDVLVHKTKKEDVRDAMETAVNRRR